MAKKEQLQELRDEAISARVAFQEHRRELMLRGEFETMDVAGRLDAVVRKLLMELEAPLPIPLRQAAG